MDLDIKFLNTLQSNDTQLLFESQQQISFDGFKVFLDNFDLVLNGLRKQEDVMPLITFIRFNLPSVIANLKNMSELVALSNRYNDSTLLKDFLYCFNKIATFLQGFKNERTIKRTQRLCRISEQLDHTSRVETF